MKKLADHEKFSSNNINHLKEAIHIVNITIWINATDYQETELKDLIQVKLIYGIFNNGFQYTLPVL